MPIFILGLIAFGAAVIMWDSFDGFMTIMIYWPVAALLGLAATALWFGRQQQRRGAGPGWHSTMLIALLTFLASGLTFFLPVAGFLPGAGFLAVAIIQRSRELGLAAFVFTAVSTLESPWGVISNALTSNSLERGTFAFELLVGHSSSLVFATLAVLLIAAATVTFGRERVGA